MMTTEQPACEPQNITLTERTVKEKILDAETILNRIIGFINNSESKTSIVLTMVGVMLTVIFALSGGDIGDMFKAVIDNLDALGILFVLLFVIFLFTSIYGAYRLVRVLVPVLDTESFKTKEGYEKDSIMFFGDISANNKEYADYLDKMKNYYSENYLNDLLSQIYVNSKICLDKYRNFDAGLKVTLPSILILFLIITIFRFLILG